MASPTVVTQTVFITTSVNAHEYQDMDIFNILGEYIHTEKDYYVIMLMEGALVDIMVKVAPKIYRKYVIVSSKG